MNQTKTRQEAYIELRAAILNLKREILKECWIFRMACRLFGLEEVLDEIIENKL